METIHLRTMGPLRHVLRTPLSSPLGLPTMSPPIFAQPTGAYTSSLFRAGKK
jgi:hypothetical protein